MRGINGPVEEEGVLLHLLSLDEIQGFLGEGLMSPLLCRMTSCILPDSHSQLSSLPVSRSG
jgi:hypothetical protein